MVDNRTSGQAVKGVGTILSELKADRKIEDYDTIENADITNIKFDVSSITLGAGDNEELTATFESGSDAGGYYAQIKGKKYPVSKVNDKIEIGKTEITTSGNSKREITSVGTSNSEVATVQILENEKDKIKITGISGGIEGIATATITINYTESISTTITVNVKAKYTVNLYASETATTANSITVVQGEKASESVGYAEPVAPTEEEIFDTWLLKTAIGTGDGEKAGDVATSYLNNVTRNLDVYATYKEKPEFGEADAALKEHFGKTVLTSSEITYGTSGWQLFYADTNKIFLIYADYLENEKIPSGTNITKSGYNVYGNSGGRDTLITYLETEENWSGVKTAFVNKYGLNSSTTGVKAKGAPTPGMWMASYNARYGTTLGTKNFNTTGQTYYETDSSTGALKTTTKETTVTGYLYTRDKTINPVKWEKFLPTQYMNQLSGYPTGSSNMYYPHTSTVSASNVKCYGYWLNRSFDFGRRLCVLCEYGAEV